MYTGETVIDCSGVYLMKRIEKTIQYLKNVTYTPVISSFFLLPFILM